MRRDIYRIIEGACAAYSDEPLSFRRTAPVAERSGEATGYRVDGAFFNDFSHSGGNGGDAVEKISEQTVRGHSRSWRRACGTLFAFPKAVRTPLLNGDVMRTPVPSRTLRVFFSVFITTATAIGASPAPQAKLVYSMPSVDFGKFFVGQLSAITIRVTNVGDAPATKIAVARLDQGAFSVDGPFTSESASECTTLAPGKSCEITVTMEGAKAGETSATFPLTYDNGRSLAELPLLTKASLVFDPAAPVANVAIEERPKFNGAASRSEPKP